MLAMALTAVRVRRWPSFGWANINANVLHVNAFQATVPGEVVSSSSVGARGKRNGHCACSGWRSREGTLPGSRVRRTLRPAL